MILVNESRLLNLQHNKYLYCNRGAEILPVTVPVLRIRTRTHSFWSAGSGSALGLRIRIQEGQNDPQK